MKRILVTGCGGPAGVNFIKSLRLVKEKIYIVGSDANKYYLELPNVNKRYLVPRCDSPNYINKLNKIIKKEKIQFVHPQPDAEVGFISENREKINTHVFLPKKETVRICQDKFESAKIWKKNNIEVAETFLIEDEDSINRAAHELGYPFWIRATKGAGGRGSSLIKNFEQAISWIRYWRARGENWQFIAQEYLPGKNIAFHSLWKDGELVVSQARERIEYIYPYLAPSGITGTPSVQVTINRKDVNKIATKAILAIDKEPEGIFCVDLKENKKGIPCPTEINAGRFFTTSLFFSTVGLNMPYYYIKLAFNEKIPKLPKYNALPTGIFWIRHMDSGPIVVRNNKWRSLKV
ncbi:MAG: ATP-grasp domain-containing protein [Candidatus Parvarchaeota archaeon]|nr:ATP-grasp domain-containing protein [Candidatus Jingweiarchaeum tengchongense]MCW1310756.1 ATP-grasp domain-containing protein [Candidatus Jingweiarchaeum tengchongense]